MKNKKFELLWAKYQETESAEIRLTMMREFMMDSSFEELIAWNDYLAEMSQKSLKKIVADGLSDEDRTFFKEQFAKFNDLEAQIKARKAA